MSQQGRSAVWHDDLVLAHEVTFGFAAVSACRLDTSWTMQQKHGVRVLLNLPGLAHISKAGLRNKLATISSKNDSVERPDAAWLQTAASGSFDFAVACAPAPLRMTGDKYRRKIPASRGAVQDDRG